MSGIRNCDIFADVLKIAEQKPQIDANFTLSGSQIPEKMGSNIPETGDEGAETGDFDPFLLTDPAKITQFPVEALENAISRRRSQKSQKTEKDNENVVRCVFSYLAAKRESEQINGQKAEIEAEMSAILADFEAFARQNGREKNDTNNGGETARKS
eukprot:TRINITY_DN7184_c0_g1_i1.p1 TRINITY_DN7184_c0_g1~~TRINITY_DN7184_c0_g1_i1.p1  ORF type:complete len:168 (+),score=20.03 TRINITY_DN7184_c0_g1_i1:39-506(+)